MAETNRQTTLVHLAGRTNLPIEAQTLLARHPEPHVRETLATNPCLDPDIRHAMARDDTHPPIIWLMATLPHGDERTFMALALRADGGVRHRLALNKAVPDAVLARILDQPDDWIARCVLKHPRSSFTTQLKALNAIVDKRSSDAIHNAPLAEDIAIDGVTYLAGTPIALHADGRVRFGTVASDQEIDGVLFTRGRTVTFLKTGRVDRREVVLPAVIDGVPCSDGQVLRTRVGFHDSGALKTAVLDADHEINGLVFPRGSLLEFFASGAVRECRPPTDMTIGDLTCPGGQMVTFSESGDVLYGSAAEAHRKRAEQAHREGRFEEAIREYGIALSWNPQNVRMGNDLAWILATCSDDRLRDGKRALDLATRVVAQSRNGPLLDTLAAAYAEVGDFPRAMATQKAAIATIGREGPKELLKPYEQRFLLYTQGKPWREPIAIEEDK